MKDLPSDQASRWSSDSNIPPQVIFTIYDIEINFVIHYNILVSYLVHSNKTGKGQHNREYYLW